MAAQKSTLSAIGIGAGSIALLLAVVHFWAGPFSPQLTLEQTVAEQAVAIKNATIAALKNEPLPPPAVPSGHFDIDGVIAVVIPILGALAIILGVAGYAMKDAGRVAIGAVGLGAMAIAFQFAGLALAAIVLALLVAAVLSQIGFA